MDKLQVTQLLTPAQVSDLLAAWRTSPPTVGSGLMSQSANFDVYQVQLLCTPQQTAFPACPTMIDIYMDFADPCPAEFPIYLRSGPLKFNVQPVLYGTKPNTVARNFYGKIQLVTQFDSMKGHDQRQRVFFNILTPHEIGILIRVYPAMPEAESLQKYKFVPSYLFPE